MPSLVGEITTNAHSLDWFGWIKGIWSASIVGGTGAVTSGVGGAVVGVSGLKNFMILTGVNFLVSAFIGLCVYLHNHPTPEPWTGEERRRTGD